jgi:hypothetical protein
MEKNMNDTNLVISLKNYFDTVKAQRKAKELEWIQNLRQYKRQYDPEILAKIREYEGSEVYPNYTRSKVKPTISKINSIFFPVTNRAWELAADNTQRVPQDILQEVNQEIAEMQQNQQPVDQDTVKRLFKNKIQNRLKQATNIIDDQFVDMKFEEKFNSVNYSAVVFGTGIMKGVTTQAKTQYEMSFTPDGVSQQEKVVYKPNVEYVPIWNVYPDYSTYDQDKLSYVFERHKMSKKDLLNLSKYEGFNEEAIRKFISENPEGSYNKPNWEQLLEGLSKDRTKPQNIMGQYEVLEYWGYIDGHFLNEEGEYNPDDSYMANVWILGNTIIYKDLADIETPSSLYHFYYYEKDDSSIFGEGLPSILRGTQLTISASARMMIDNSTTTVSPQVEVNVDLLTAGQDISKYHPRKIWYREGRGNEAQYPAIRAINFDSHIQDYLAIIQAFKQFGDEESNLPAFIWGSTENIPSRTTATGMTQLNSNTNLSIADVVKGFEKENMKLLTQLIKWNRDYNDSTNAFDIAFSAKGFGYEAQVHRETLLQALGQFNASIPQQDEIYINKQSLYRHEIKLLNLPYDDIVRTQEEVDRIMASQQDQEAQQLAKAQAAAEVEYTRSKAANMLAKSQDTLDKIQKGDNT